MYACMSSMTLFYRRMTASSRVYHVTQEDMLLAEWGSQTALEERSLETGMAWSTEPSGRGTAHLLTFHQLKAEQKRGENLPTGTGRDKTEHSPRVKSNPTCHLRFQPPTPTH